MNVLKLNNAFSGLVCKQYLRDHTFDMENAVLIKK